LLLVQLRFVSYIFTERDVRIVDDESDGNFAVWRLSGTLFGIYQEGFGGSV
jgi:hypothetical protein